ncbi:MAG: hypothetical protein GXY22_02445 [Clostridiaceae bacterium]|nr:hypothetical protein [Clostridiaceae bacterium]
MKITSIKIERLAVPLITPYHLSGEYGIFSTATPVIVTMTTDEELSGIGECDPWPLFTGDSAESVMTVLTNHLAPMLIGCDPCNINELHRRMNAVIRNQLIAKSAIDMAAYDLLGKSSGLPVHALLGGKQRHSMPVMWSVGGSTPEECAKDVLTCMESGYVGCMIKVGTADWRGDALRVAAARDAVGSGFPLIVDANQGWDTDTAIRFWKQIRNCDVLFFEQPVQSWDIEGMAKVRRVIDIPLSADESCATPENARRLIASDAADIFSIKVTKHGGILPARRICELADINGIQVFFNSMIEEGVTQAASLELCVTCANLVDDIGHAFFSPLRLDGDICDYYKRIGRGYVLASDRPGIGIELDDEQMKKYRVETDFIGEHQHDW